MDQVMKMIEGLVILVLLLSSAAFYIPLCLFVFDESHRVKINKIQFKIVERGLFKRILQEKYLTWIKMCCIC